MATIKPGEEFDPCGPESFGSEWSAWTPAKEGKYALIFTCDYAAKELSLWNGPVERGAGLGDLESTLAKVPKITLTAKIEVAVQP